jgi:hypothetical protein
MKNKKNITSVKLVFAMQIEKEREVTFSKLARKRENNVGGVG